MLEDVGMKFSISGEYDTLQDIKEKHGYVAYEYDSELKGRFGFILDYE